jgi:hypothetical protein
MGRLAGVAIDQRSPLRYVVATSTQANSLNEDLNGIPRNFVASLTWQQLGGLSASAAPVPEPESLALVGLGLAAAWAAASGWRRR